jgi:gliding motility-associated protein GldM
MATYEANGKKYSFKAPDDAAKLKDALKTVNPDDTAQIAKIYRSLTIPATLKVKHAGEEVTMPWASVMFDHAPIVAAAAMFTAITVDLKQAENDIVSFMLNKVDAPSFNFNKIEPMAFARTGYLNQGDTMSLRVMIAAYDSTETPKILWNGTEFNGPIPIKAGSPGAQNMEGVIYVKERGQEVPKPWNFSYTVGKPSGAVSLPEMFVLYRGYPNKVVGAASGYADYKLVGTNNVTLSKQGQEYIASPGSGREATISLQGVSPDGKSANLGSFQFRVRGMPKPSVKLGSCEDGSTHTANVVKAQTRIFAGYGDEIPLQATFTVKGYEIAVSGAPRAESGSGPNLSGPALGLIKQARPGATITLMTEVVGPDGITKRSNAVIKVK